MGAGESNHFFVCHFCWHRATDRRYLLQGTKIPWTLPMLFTVSNRYPSMTFIFNHLPFSLYGLLNCLEKIPMLFLFVWGLCLRSTSGRVLWWEKFMLIFYLVYALKLLAIPSQGTEEPNHFFLCHFCWNEHLIRYISYKELACHNHHQRCLQSTRSF